MNKDRKTIQDEAERLENLHAYMVMDDGEPCMVWAESRGEFDGPAVRLSDRAVCAYICEAMIDQSKMFHALTETMEAEAEVAKKNQQGMAQMLSGQMNMVLGEDGDGNMVCLGDFVKHKELGITGSAMAYDSDSQVFSVRWEDGTELAWAKELVEKQPNILPVTEVAVSEVVDDEAE